MKNNKYFELLRTEILKDKSDNVKDLLNEEEFYNLNNEEKVSLLTSEDEDGYSILTLALTNSLDALSVLLNSKVFFGFSEDQCLKVLRVLLTSAISQTSKEIHVLLDSRMVQKLSASSLYSFLIQNEDGESPLNQAIKVAPENMRTLLDSVALEKLDSNKLLKCLTGDDVDESPIVLAMKKSSLHMKMFLESRAIERLDSSKAFEYLRYS